MPTKPAIAPTTYKWGFHDEVEPIYKSPKGLSSKVVESISHYKNEPAWMLEFRLRALKIFEAKPMPTWGADLSSINFDNIYYYIKPTEQTMHSWEEVPDRIKATFDKLGIPAAEQKYLAGVGTQYDSENVYHNLRANLAKQGVIFCDVETATQKYPELVKQYFATAIPPGDNKFAALNSACWSGGSFIYVPPGVRLEQPLQTYFRINAKNMGQFERTLIIVDEGAFVHYIEGCFTKGTAIIANTKSKPIEDIKVGDKVLTHTAKYKRVYSVYKRKYTGFLYKIEMFGDSTVVLNVTEEHPFLSVTRKRRNERNKTWDAEWKTPRELQPRDYLVMPIQKAVCKRDSYPFIIRGQVKGKRVGIMEYKTHHIPATAEFFRLVGYYLAEGSVNRDFYLNFSFSVEEKKYVKDVKYLLNKIFGIKKFYEPVHNKGVSVVASSAKLARIFKNFGASSSAKSILNWMMTAETEKQKELIKGLFRGDGNYYQKRHKSGLKEVFRINTTSYALARQARDILLRLGVVSFLNKMDRSKEGRQTMYTVGVSGEYMALFGEIVGIPVAKSIHKHKRATMFYADNNYAYFPIKEIKTAAVKDIEVFNFAVEEDESYTAYGLAVHNCSAPIYATSSLHAAVVEIIAKRGARVRYTTVQNWSNDVYNLVTKRAFAHEEAIVEWVDFNMGSKITMKYPGVYMVGRGARADILSMAYAGNGQHLDAGGKAVHLASDTSSRVISKSVSHGGGRTSYRGLLRVGKGARGVKSKVQCDALILDPSSRSDTYPVMKIEEDDATIEHEATVSKIGEEQLFYLMSRGLTADEAALMIVNGFIEPLVKELPLEYAVEMNRMIALEMEGSVG